MINETSWPPSIAEETVYLEDMVKRLAAAKIGGSTLVVRSFTQPTTEQWNAVWIKKSSLLPPIPTGTKLAWYDLRSGRMRLFTTANNLQNGADSDGEVIPWTIESNDASCFRLLGSLNAAGDMVSAYTRSDGTVTSLMLNEKLWRQRGLRKLIIHFQTLEEFPIGTTDFEIQLIETSATQRGKYDITFTTLGDTVRAKRADAGATSVIDTFTEDEANKFSGTLGSFDGDTLVMGIMEIDLPNTPVGGEFKPQIGVSVGTMYLVKTGVPGAGNSEITAEMSAFSRRSSTNTQRYSFPTPRVASTSLKMKAWIYGVFETAPPTEPGEY